MSFSEYKKGTVLSVSADIVLVKITENSWMVINDGGETEYASDREVDIRVDFDWHVNVLSPSDGYMEMDRIYSKMLRGRVGEPREDEGCFVIEYWGELTGSIDNCKSITYYPYGVESLDQIPKNAVYVPAEDRKDGVEYNSADGSITVIVNGPVVGINPEDIAAKIKWSIGDVL